MEWNEKKELCTLLNNGEYADAVEFIRNKEIDPQAMDMFITGFDLTMYQILKPIKDIILSYDGSKLDWRSKFRLELLKEKMSNFDNE